ncbi:MAG: DNA replication/repair protein RecF [Gemmatimonadales bacterium]
MRLDHLAVRGFRNLADFECSPPAGGVFLLGANAQGKTSFLEAVGYPVVFRSSRGAPDQEIVTFGGTGFQIDASLGQSPAGRVSVSYLVAGRTKRVAIDDAEADRLTEAVGRWLAVSFLPRDVGLASGPASERRQYLDRLLSLADPRYLRSLLRYRAALAQRNSALRQGKIDLARVFDGALASPGAEVVRARSAWAEAAGARYGLEFDCLGERSPATLRYRTDQQLADASGWPATLEAALPRDRALGLTTVGPHRDDLELQVGGKPLRTFGSTGQHRSAAVGLKLIELETLRMARGTEPALLLDDVFAELDRNRQRRLAGRFFAPGRQVFLTAPRREEAPEGLELEVWTVREGRVTT